MQCVLLVDDNNDNLYFLQVLLQGNGFGVRTARNGAEALASARENPPELIISDILMPVMDGYVLCSECLADPRLRQIPFMFYTATYTEAKDEELAMNLGANRFVVKPQEPDVLLEIIREVLASRCCDGATAPADSLCEESELLREYNEVLFRKLEKKMADLELVNRELAESEQCFRHFVTECPIPIGISDLDGTIWLLNRKFVETFGYTTDDIPDVTSWWLRAYPDPAYRAEVVALWETALQEGKTIDPGAEFRVTCKDGRVRIVEICGSASINRLMLVFNDITARKQAEQERTDALQRHNEELEERVRLRTRELEVKVAELDSFTSAVSHDLRSPLRRLRSYSEMLLENLDGRLEDAEVQILQKICRTSNEATELVNALLDLSRIGKTRVVREEVDLSGLATEILNGLSAAEPERNHRFTVTAGLRANADRQLMRIVLTNLLDNAWKFSARQAETRISLTTAAADDGSSVFCVADNGAGFDMDYACKLFMPFQRLHGQHEFSGIGIGLSTVNSIIHLHDGRIWAESGPDGGAKFYFTLGALPASPTP
jgi:PAS domain S-box-containing protein